MNQTDKDTIIMENMGLVKMVVNRHASRIKNNPSLDKEDLTNIGVIGLIKAYDNFDSSRGLQFSTYAVPMIDYEIRRYFRDNAEIIKFSRTAKEDSYMMLELGMIDETKEVIAKKMNISDYRVQNALDYYRNRFTDSMDREIFNDGGEPLLLGDTISEEVDFDTDLEIELLLNKLNGKVKQVVELRLQDLSQVEIGKIMGISQVQVSRYLKQATKIIEGDKKVSKHNKENPKVKKVEKEPVPDFTLAKKLAETTDLNASMIRNRTGVAYATAWNYIKEYREEEKKVVEKVKTEPLKEVKLVKEEIKVLEEKKVEKDISSYGHMAMTFEVGLDGASNRLEDIISAMKVLGFEGLKITIQGEQSA